MLYSIGLGYFVTPWSVNDGQPAEGSSKPATRVRTRRRSLEDQLCTSGLPRFSTNQAIDIAIAAGFDGIEIGVVKDDGTQSTR
jgi:hypothetical protein